MSGAPFGILPSGHVVERITISGHGLTASLISWGASLQDLRLDGFDHPLVLGFPELDPYLGEGRYFGAIVGRCANRIAGGHAVVEGRLLQLDRNENGRHSLHGGSEGSGQRNWIVAEHESHCVAFADYIPDGHMGYPGAMLVRTVYTILPGPTLQITILATADEPTLCNFAQHSYFNLDGSRDIANHRLTIPAETYLPVNDDLIPDDSPCPVQSTHLDFRKPVRLGDRLSGPLIDHNLCLGTAQIAQPRKAATLQADHLQMSIRSNQPGLQVYAGQHIRPGAEGISGQPYQQFGGIALESQLWPDAPHNESFPSAVLPAGRLYKQVTQLSFNTNWQP